MATVKFLNRCSGGNHFDIEIATASGVFKIPVDWNSFKDSKKQEELKNQIYQNIRTRINLINDYETAKTTVEALIFQE